MEVSGSRAIVVGGASGMGRATAEMLSARGANVVILDRTESDDSTSAGTAGAFFYKVDVTDFEGAEQVLAAAVSRLGGLDVLVTTAGGGMGTRTLTREGPHNLALFRSILDLNIVATFNLNRLAADYMSRNEPTDGERGVLINTSSLAAFEGQIGQVAYSAAKAAIAGMSLTMARDLGSLGIRAMAIAPSLFETGATADLPEDMKARLVQDAAFPRRMGRPIEYAKLAIAIIENSMLNGQAIRLDAGQRMAPK